MFTDFVVNKDEDRERDWWKPPHKVEWSGLEKGVHSWAVAEEDGQKRLENEGLVHLSITHTLLKQRQHPGFTDNQIGPLYNNDGAEVRGLSGLQNS